MAGGCLTATDVPVETVVEDREPLEDLQPVGSCESLQGVLAVRALSQMEPILKRNQALATLDCNVEPPIQTRVPVEFDNAPPPSAANPENLGNGAPAYSRSNNQVAGVAEADRVQTDGEHLYVLTDAGLEILRVWPPESAGHVATVPVGNGVARGLFVFENHALIYVDDEALALKEAEELATYGPYGAPQPAGGMCPFGVRCDFSGNGKMLRMITLDLANPAAPRVVRQTEYSGSFLAARRIGDAVHTAIDFPPPTVQGLSFWPAGLPECGVERNEAQAAFDALRRANISALVDRPLNTWLPRVVDERLPDTADALRVEGLVEGCDSVWYAHLQSGRSFLSLVSQTMAGDQRLATQTIVAEPGAIYVSPDSLYVASRQRAVSGEGWYDAVPDHTEATVIHRFALGTQASPVDGRVRPSASYQGSAAVPGLLLNRYALDERAGRLRVLSTLGLGGASEDPDAHDHRDPILEFAASYGDEVSDVVLPDPPVTDPPGHAASKRTTRVAVLGSNSIGRLRLNSEAEAAMASSDLSAVRFVGDWALLAFGAEEPLQIVDLSDPDEPRMGGNLKLAGEGRFLHPLGDGRLLSVSVVGNTGSQGGDQTVIAENTPVDLALELFDLSDPDAVRALGGARFARARSAAVADALAVSWYEPQSVLGVPMQQCATEDGGEAFDGLVVFGVDATDGFVERGRIDHRLDTSDATCEPVPAVRRSVFIEDTVVSVGRRGVTLTGLDDFVLRAAIGLEGDATWPPVEASDAGQGGVDVDTDGSSERPDPAPEP